MRETNRRAQPDTGEAFLLWMGIGLVVAVLATVTPAVYVGHRWAGLTEPLPRNPFEIVFGVVVGRVAWPAASTGVAVAEWVLLAGVAAAVVVVGRRRRGRRTRADRAAAYLGQGRDISDISEASVAAKASRLGLAEGASTGIPIGTSVAGGKRLFGSWEDMHIDIWGPRTGKTTSRAIPALLEAPGAVIATSNKRDLVDATRDVRADRGEVWVFDPQGVAGEAPTWWWNPFSYVLSGTDAEVKAKRLAGHFAAGSRDGDAKTDAYFDPAGQDLLAGYFLAGALGGKPITQVQRWLTRPGDETPARILQEHGYEAMADQVGGIQSAPDKQKLGVYGTAQQMSACLTIQSILGWVTPGEDGGRPEFDPSAFLAKGETLYSLSREGAGSAGPLVTALTVAVVECAEEQAARSAGGRLRTPLVGVLDEAANVCRWGDLPDQYSHYGSRGIVLMTILQSWSQGVKVWGESGMWKLWSSSNVKVYGGGVTEEGFLRHLSEVIGDFDKLTTSVSSGKGSSQRSRSLHRERIFDVASLASLPRGRAIVLSSGSRPTLIRTNPWMDGPYADAVRASIAAHDPGAVATTVEGKKSLAGQS